MEVIKNRIKNLISKFNFKKLFSFSNKNSHLSSKRDFNGPKIFFCVIFCAVVFITVTLFLPTEEQVKFSEVAQSQAKTESTPTATNDPQNKKATNLWGSPKNYGSTQSSVPNYNASMLVMPNGGNSALELAAGTHLRIKIVDKFIASQEATPVMAKVLEEATTQSGLSIPANSLMYGEASYNKPSSRAMIQFRKISLPSGEIRPISADVVSPDGMPGLEGTIHSDSVKNSAGQIITTFVSGLAGGAMEKDFFGNSKGGITNGLLQAVSETTKDRAQKYGESLKESREWIEVQSGVECEAILKQSMKLLENQEGK